MIYLLLLGLFLGRLTAAFELGQRAPDLHGLEWVAVVGLQHALACSQQRVRHVVLGVQLYQMLL